MSHATISQYRLDDRFATCANAYLVSGTQTHEPLNRKLLAERRTGHWAIAEGRIFRGDAIFVLLRSHDPNKKNQRELYAGCVTNVEISDLDAKRKVVSVKRFYQLESLTESVKVFLNGKLPLAGNRVLTVWKSVDMTVELQTAFQSAVEDSGRLSSAMRAKRLAKAPRYPSKRVVTSVVFDRNPDVVAEVLYRAKGTCEVCSKTAPFLRKTDRSPYLEVHHIKRLADGGEDTVENAMAICPNCHRKYHFGV